jgi:dihydrofolate reductase
MRECTAYPDQNILIYASGELVNALMQHHLMDVYRVMFYPLVLGTGRHAHHPGHRT